MGSLAFLFSEKSGIRGKHSLSLCAAAAIILLLLLLLLCLLHLSYQIINCEADVFFANSGSSDSLVLAPMYVFFLIFSIWSRYYLFIALLSS
jgi:hypothetical protein